MRKRLECGRACKGAHSLFTSQGERKKESVRERESEKEKESVRERESEKEKERE